jgi:type VI secretion system protein ImpE
MLTLSPTESLAATLLREGRPREALDALTTQVRGNPADASQRLFLFQLLALLGQWERAGNQLQVAAELDASHALLASNYQLALRGERQRAAVMAGQGWPTMIGEPSRWQALLLQSLRCLLGGQLPEALALREQAFEQAAPIGGLIDGTPFEWIADADPRFGPCLEVMLSGGYAWVPFARLRELRFEPPFDLRDKVWAQVQLTWHDGGQALGLVPCRYPGSEGEADSALVMASRTDWHELGQDCFVGRGQRMLSTDAGDYPLLDIRSIRFESVQHDG